MHVNHPWAAFGSMVLPNIGGIAGSFIVRKNITPWYDSLIKPDWRPPNWVFGPIWTGLYCSIGYASYLVWRTGDGFEKAAVPLSIYAANIALNWAWTPIFFGAHNIKMALYEVSVMWVSTVALGVAFYRCNRVAGALIVPYLGWTTLATVLNYVIYRDNPQQPANQDKIN